MNNSTAGASPSSLSQLALDFCRECLGWKDAYYPDGITHSCFTRKMGISGFRYTDLNAVMAAIKEWCEMHDAVLVLSYGKGKSFNAMVDIWDIPDAVGKSANTDPCYALLTACVEARRNLKLAA